MSESEINKREREQLVFFNEAVEYFEKSNVNPIHLNQTDNSIDPNHLRDQMLEELNNLKDLIIDNPDLKFDSLSEEEKERFHEFINFYSVCPLCGTYNHFYLLKNLFFSEEKRDLKEKLIKFMRLNNARLDRLKLDFGIPCCNCFKQHFEQEK